MAFSVETSLDRYVEAIAEPREPDGLWHPSSLGGCDRKALYEVRGTPKSNPPDARTRRVFRVGHLMHEFVQTAIALDPSVLRFFAEVALDAPDLRVTGHADGLLTHVDGSWEVLEFKTISSRAFQYGDLPKPDHVGQLSLYMKVLREYGGRSGPEKFQEVIPPLGERLARGRVIYVSKDDLRIGEYGITWSDAKDEEIRAKLARLESYREAGTLPDRLPVNGSKRHYLCGYCPFQDHCWGES